MGLPSQWSVVVVVTITVVGVIGRGDTGVTAQKVGLCRHLVPGGPERANCHPDLCQEDSDCPGIEICCFDGCAKACSLPQRPGFCPRRDYGGFVGPACSHDFDCPRRLKCCEIPDRCRQLGRCSFCVIPTKGPQL